MPTNTLYSPNNFIKTVKNDRYIYIQDIYDNTRHIIDYEKFTSAIPNGNSDKFIDVKQDGHSEDFSMEFSSSQKAIEALSKLMTIIYKLKNGTYSEDDLYLTTEDIYEPDTFIYEISYEDYTIRLINNKGELTTSITAKQVTTVYTDKNSVKIKTEASDLTSEYMFTDEVKAIIGARKLREAIKKIVNKTSPTDSNVKYYSEEFEGTDWVLEPNDITFSMSNISLTYYEIGCPTGPSGSFIDTTPGVTCSTQDEIKLECKGLVEYEGDIENDILDKVNIRFNQSVKGVAILMGK